MRRCCTGCMKARPAGCAWCCTVPVSVLPQRPCSSPGISEIRAPEALEALHDRLRLQAAQIAALSTDAHAEAQLPVRSLQTVVVASILSARCIARDGRAWIGATAKPGRPIRGTAPCVCCCRCWIWPDRHATG